MWVKRFISSYGLYVADQCEICRAGQQARNSPTAANAAAFRWAFSFVLETWILFLRLSTHGERSTEAAGHWWWWWWGVISYSSSQLIVDVNTFIYKMLSQQHLSQWLVESLETKGQSS